MQQRLYGLFGMLLLGALCVPQAHAANIITFDDNANSCGGAVICSTNGTTGYLINGTGQAFDLSTISQWFQIDPAGVNQIAGQPEAEPDMGAGGFRVLNDTGSAVTSFSLTLTDTFDSSTQSVQACGAGPQSGNICDNFTAHGSNGFNTELSGSDWNDCTQGTAVGSTCQGGGGGVAADFAPNQIIYSWSGGSIAAGTYFDITFASWQAAGPNSNNAFVGGQSPVPEPASIVLLCSILVITSVTSRKKKRCARKYPIS